MTVTAKAQATAGDAAAKVAAAPDRFFKVPMTPLKGGKLVALNEELLPELPLRKDRIAERMCLFVDWNGKETEFELLGLLHHNRVAYLPIEISDKHGNEYECIGFKGGGMPKDSHNGRKFRMTVKKEGESGVVFGLERKVDALHDMEVSNKLIEAGMHTAAYVAVIELSGIRTERGRVISIDDARERGRIPKGIVNLYNGETVDFDPVICLRAMRTPLRLSDITREDVENYAAERGMCPKEYFKWWIGEFARNLAILHDTGMTHDNLIGHNVTLAGEIVDLNTVIARGVTKMREDIADALRLVRNFSDIGMNSAHECRLGRALFMKTYLENRKNVGMKERAVLLSGCVNIPLTACATLMGFFAFSAIDAAFSGDWIRAGVGAFSTSVLAVSVNYLAPEKYQFRNLLASIRASLRKGVF